MIFGGVTLLMTLIEAGVAWKVVFAQLGKFAITGSFAMIYVYAVEIFPTVVRNVGIGSSSMCARVGSIVAPYIGRELGHVLPAAPIVIFGLTSLVAGVLVLLLPETRNCNLPDTIMEGEAFSRENGGFNWCKK